MKDIAKQIGALLTKKLVLALVGTLGASFFVVMGIIMLVLIMLIGISGGSVNQSASASSSFCSTTGEINKEKWDLQFSNAGVFTGKGDLFIELSNRYGIDPVLAAAIAFHETGFGTSPAVVNKNNPGGIMDPETNWQTIKHFSTLEEGLDYTIHNLKRRVIDDGLTTIESLGNVYAPIGAVNDPNGLNAYWVPKVTQYANDLGGLTMNCSVLVSGELSSGLQSPLARSLFVTSPFGWRNLGGVEHHNGIDLACTYSDPIFTVSDGVVIHAGVKGTYGNLVQVRHNGFITAYAHLSSISVSVGQEVTAGSQLGMCGTTGRSTGTHLHFEVKSNEWSGHMDPAPYLGL